MAEFCLPCWNALNRTNLTEAEVLVSKDLDFCEGCAQWKPIVEGYKKRLWIFKRLFP